MSIEEGAQPFVKWVGGKRSLLQVILPLRPDAFENYFEPFAGGGALYFALAPGLKKATLVDRNLELVLAYQSIKKQPARFSRDLRHMPRNTTRITTIASANKSCSRRSR
jgi:DNA adenine methylase